MFTKLNYSKHIVYCQARSKHFVVLLKLGGESVMDYTKRLYDLRTDNDYRQEDVAEYLQITKQAYGMYENGKRNLSIDCLIKLSKFYNVSTDFILCLTDNPGIK